MPEHRWHLDASPTLEADMAEQDGIRTAAEMVQRGDDSAERCSRLHFEAGASPRGAQAAEGASDAESPPHGPFAWSTLTSTEADALGNYLEAHAEDIRLGVNDFGDLRPLLVWLCTEHAVNKARA